MAKFDVDRVFTRHPLSGSQVHRSEAIYIAVRDVARLIESLCQNSREKSLAFTALQDATQWADASMAVNETVPEHVENTTGTSTVAMASAGSAPIDPCAGLGPEVNEVAGGADQTCRRCGRQTAYDIGLGAWRHLPPGVEVVREAEQAVIERP